MKFSRMPEALGQSAVKERLKRCGSCRILNRLWAWKREIRVMNWWCSWKNISAFYLLIMQHRESWHLTQINTIIIPSAAHRSPVCRLSAVSIMPARAQPPALWLPHKHTVCQVCIHHSPCDQVKVRFSAAPRRSSHTAGEFILNCLLKWARLC